MSDIYQKTTRCMVWLGELAEVPIPDPIITLAESPHTIPYDREGPVKYTNLQRSGVTMTTEEAHSAFNFLGQYANMADDGHFTADCDDIPPGWVSVTQAQIQDVQKFMSLDWWHRIWTVQELLLPPRVALVLGTIQCDETIAILASKRTWDLAFKHKHLQCCNTVFSTTLDSWMSVRLIVEKLVNVRRRNRRSKWMLGDAAAKFRDRKCTDPRDKIFALFGLTDPMTRQLADYSLTKREAYTRAYRYAISEGSSLTLLMRPSELNRDMSLPSWVPDLEAGCHGNDQEIVDALIRQEIFGSQYAAAGQQQPLDLAFSREDELRLSGLKVDRIKCLLGVPRLDGKSMRGNLWQPRAAAWRTMLERDQALDFDHYPSGGDYTEAFWRTCTYDVYNAPDGRCKRLHLENMPTMKTRLARDWGVFILITATFFVTEKGYIGVGPERAQVGDFVYVLYGGTLPFILRGMDNRETAGTHTYVGHAYVHGIMDGEALEMGIKEEKVVIV